MTTFYIIRHGNTELNKKKLQGGRIDSPLRQEGVKDALFILKKLKNVKFDAIYSSDLGRAFTTAYIIASALGFKRNILRANEFREIDFGDFTYMNIEEAVKLSKFKENCTIKCPNGESYLQVKNRVIKKLLSITKIKYNNVLVVTHAGCIRGILSEATKKNLNLLLEKEIPHRFIIKAEIKNDRIMKFEIFNK